MNTSVANKFNDAKFSKTDIFLFLLLAYISSGTSVISNSLISIAVVFVVSGLVFFKRGYTINRNMIVVISLVLIFILVHTIINMRLPPSFSSRIIMLIMLTYFVVSIIGEHFFYLLYKVVYYLTLISLLLFLLQNLQFGFFYDLTLQIQDILQIPPVDYDGLYSSNIIIYTVNTTSFHRNCGFMFEPGAFASVIGIALYFSVVNNKFRIFARENIVLTIGMITTFSTTGYLMFIVILVFISVNRSEFMGKQSNIGIYLFLPISIIIAIGIFQLEFVGDKIIDVIAGSESQLNRSYYTTIEGQQVSLGRFAGLLYDLEDFVENPIIGFGGNREVSANANFYMSMRSINGFSGFIAQFGIYGTILLLIGLIRSSILLKVILKYRYAVFLPLLYMLANFSFEFILAPLFLTIVLYALAISGRKEKL